MLTTIQENKNVGYYRVTHKDSPALLISYALITGIFPMSKLQLFSTKHSFLLRYITLSQVYWHRNGELSKFKVQSKYVWRRCILLISPPFLGLKLSKHRHIGVSAKNQAVTSPKSVKKIKL